MKNKLTQTFLATLLGLVMLFAGTQIFVSGQDNENQEQRNGRSIQGTWQTIVTPVNCQTGVPVAPAFQGLLTFNKGGTLAGTNTAVASLFGVWQRERGGQNYSFAFTNFRYNATGVFIGTQTVRQTGTLGAGGNEFTTTGTAEFFDTNGNLVGTGCSTVTGTRFE